MLRCLLLIAAFAAALAMLHARGEPLARAETEGSVAIGCELLISPIDGDPDDVPTPLGADGADACDGIDASDIANLANALGDEDDELEASDFAALDLDANQVQLGGATIFDEIVVFAFVDNDAVVTFDAEGGLDTRVHDDGGGFSTDGDANPETCTAQDDLDCDNVTLADGDGVAAATLTLNLAASMGDLIAVDMFQADDVGQINTETIRVVGPPDDIMVEANKSSLQVSGDLSDVDDCTDESDARTPSQFDDINRALLKTTVRDDDGVELTRVWVDYSVDDDERAAIDDDSGEPASDPKATTGLSIAGQVPGDAASFAILCGGIETGIVTITATETTNDNDAFIMLNVVGPPFSIDLEATPPQLVCDNVNTATITATVRDSGVNLVADGVPVNFSVTSVGVVSPINTTTVNGVATTTFRGFSTWSVGVPVIVTSGDAQSSILVICQGVADVDGDGLPNAFETARACLSPSVADGNLDQDTDAITSINEFFASGTEPCVYDTDTDGCADGEEIEAGRTHQAGGERNPLNGYDFYDVNASGRIDAADIGLVRFNFAGGAPTPPEDVIYDRSAGVASWAPNGPDGFINAVDIGLVRFSFNDRCDLAP